MTCEIKHLERRWNEMDEEYICEPKEDEKPEQQDWWRRFAICIVNNYRDDDESDTSYLYVNPMPLRKLLKDVIGDYPDIDINSVQIEAPYYPLFHYRKELEKEGYKRFMDDAESNEQLELLLYWIDSHFVDDISAYEKCISVLKAISYESLWTLFPPNKIIYANILNQDRALRVNSCYYKCAQSGEMFLNISASFIDFDGKTLGTRDISFCIMKYVGTRQLGELTTMPLDLLDDGEKVRAELVKRGRKFESTQRGYRKFILRGHIMIDCETYHRFEGNDVFDVVGLGDSKSSKELSHEAAVPSVDFVRETRMTFDKLSEDDALITNGTVRGYHFESKKFLEFSIDNVWPIEWNTHCFDDLVLDPATKKTVKALVSTHPSTFDDIVKGKGQGLVCVLHGPPGVGKTLTVECVAEFVKRPLYVVSSGDLSRSIECLESYLSRIMDLASTWNALLLIDEADIFLEQRSLHDVLRNAMVGVFLRAFEQYKGILFLTTNRVSIFDEAFKSRIHVPIRYTDLSMKSREQIWRNLCRRVPGGVNVDDAGFKELAEPNLNGRQIKNTIKVAESLAAFDGVKVGLEQLKQVTRMHDTFEKDMTAVGGVDYTAPGEPGRMGDGFNMFM
ncbi:P-loop containing nucleoside triphosphate hydrolase protein [Daldinia caldariorum]|uniref:P-loop containing nucleoside triphosphate hydrolase protein n=1 Tax=Daldinia caldariorum TaxID=326644 RepID=UPI002008AD90|nr:P-loop containing nucleoside triphosphate hydrolase protein [Daldinia caldariorum]KAI1467189.1 P-loop containing nucleoside triphosphate hydrolase protein [Daldinia caldariorum]